MRSMRLEMDGIIADKGKLLGTTAQEIAEVRLGVNTAVEDLQESGYHICNFTERLNLSSGERAEVDQRFMDNYKLVYACINLYNLAQRGERLGIEEDDLIQAGMIGLLRACDSFDEKRGVTFATYAYPCIKSAIIRHIDKYATGVKVPVSRFEQFRKLKRVNRSLCLSFGRRPTDQELCDALGWDLKKLQAVKAVSGTNILFDGNSTLIPGGDVTIFQTIKVEDDELSSATFLPDVNQQNFLDRFKNRFLETLLEEKSVNYANRSYDIVLRRFGFLSGDSEGESLESIGQSYGVTRERIRQLEKEALAYIRTSEKLTVLLAKAVEQRQRMDSKQ